MKINKILLTLGFVTALSISVSSCKDDFLQEDLTSTYSTQTFETQEGLDLLVTGAYQKLKFKFNYIWGIKMFNLGVDEFTDGGSKNEAFNQYSSSLNSEEKGSNVHLWQNMYAGIESANTIIKNMPLYYDKENASYNTRLGEGYFLRAYFYLTLVSQYGGVPLKLEPSTAVETYFTRATEEECFAQIIADFKIAYDLLPASPEATGRISQSAAAHFLAKSHLTRASELYNSWNSSYVAGDLDEVIKYGEEVYNAHPLCADYVELWDYQQPNGANEMVSEIVLAAQFSDDNSTWGRFGNQMHLYYPSVYQNIAGTVRDISGDREFSYARSTNYALDVFDRVNDSRFWKSFITTYGCNSTANAPTWDKSNYELAPDSVGDPIEEITADGDIIYKKRFLGGELGIKYIVNSANDNRYADFTGDATAVMKEGSMCPTHTFVRYFDGEDQSWIGKHGNQGYVVDNKPVVATSRFVALSKFRDGYRQSVASAFGTRDAILARSADDVLMVAEAYIRKGPANYDKAIMWINYLRDRASFKDGENRSVHVDGGQAYKNNPYCEGKGGGYSAEGSIYWERNTYYESNGDMAETIASTTGDLRINSTDDIYNSSVDSPIYDALGCAGDADKMMCFLLNERTRELCGETLRWEDLARTKTLEARYKAFNDGFGQGAFNAATHYYRPIPQAFLNAITNENGQALTPAERQEMQNPGY